MSASSAVRVPALVPTAFSDGSLQLMKLVAVVLMTLDHINTHIWGGSSPLAFNLGRLAMPIFAVVFAFNLARPGALDRHAFERLALRLIAFGMVACVPYMALNGSWPLNVLFTFLMALSVCLLLEREHYRFAVFCFLIGGLLVEYLWFGIALVVAAWWYFKQPTALRLASLVLVWAGLVIVNGSHSALLAIPLVGLLSRARVNLPRSRWVFYLYYPAHLALIVLVASGWPSHGGQS
jgi:hypothetical protein